MRLSRLPGRPRGCERVRGAKALLEWRLVEHAPSGGRFRPCYLLGVTRFVRVANRHGWEVEVVGSAGAVESKAFASRDEALAHAESLEPDWIEIGEIVALDTPDQQHSWTTLRRGANGRYEASQLRWQAERRRPRPGESGG